MLKRSRRQTMHTDAWLSGTHRSSVGGRAGMMNLPDELRALALLVAAGAVVDKVLLRRWLFAAWGGEPTIWDPGKKKD